MYQYVVNLVQAKPISRIIRFLKHESLALSLQRAHGKETAVILLILQRAVVGSSVLFLFSDLKFFRSSAVDDQTKILSDIS